MTKITAKTPPNPGACLRLVNNTLTAHGLDYKLDLFVSPDFGSVFITILNADPKDHDAFREVEAMARQNGFGVLRGR